MKSVSHVQLFVTPWTAAYHTPQSMEFSRQEYWNGLPFPSPGDLPDPGIEPGSPALQADSYMWDLFLKIIEKENRFVVIRPDARDGGGGIGGKWSKGTCVCMSVTHLCLTLWILWTVAFQAHLSTEFSKQEYWSR